MLDVKYHDDTIRVISIDPGSNNCGFAVLTLNLLTFKVHVDYMETLHSTALKKKYKEYIPLYGERESKNIFYGYALRRLLEAWGPVEVIAESSYMGRFAAAFKALVEQVTVFRSVCHFYDDFIPFRLFEPSTAKKAMGVPGGSKDKELMRKALMDRDDLIFENTNTLLKADEHSVDAVAIGLTRLDILKRQCFEIHNN